MKAFLVSKLRARTLVALSLTMAALLLLLGMWSWLPPVKAREPAAIGLGSADLMLSSSDTITTSIFLPIVFRGDVIFSDDFSDTSSGWPHEVTLDEECYVKYYNGHYRVKVTEEDQICFISNSSIPKLINGTFSVRVRRTSDTGRHLYYGLIFGAGADASRNRWVVEIYPNKDARCGNDKPFYQLVAIGGGRLKYYDDNCTDAIDTDEDDWNELTVIRNGENIRVYINGKLKGDYDDATYLLDEGNTLLEVVSLSDETIYVEFDDLLIRQSTATP
jgi:hypothetical protein